MVARQELQRLPDWPARLTAYMREVSRQTFQHGEHDCALFAAGAVEAVTGVYPIPDIRGTYSDADGAARVLAEHGYDRSLFKTCYKLFGRPVPGAFARRGDLAWGSGAGALGVVVGRYAVFFSADEREDYLRVKLSKVRFAFRVG